MKKFSALVLAILLVSVALVACNKQPAENNDGQQGEQQGEQQVQKPVQQPQQQKHGEHHEELVDVVP